MANSAAVQNVQIRVSPATKNSDLYLLRIIERGRSCIVCFSVLGDEIQVCSPSY